MQSAVIGCLLVIAVNGCPSGSIYDQTRTVQYPASWPIKELTVPKNSVQIPIFQVGTHNPDLVWEEDGIVSEPGSEWENHRWKITFKSSAPPSEVQSHIDSCLKPLGFRLGANGQLPGEGRVYFSKDLRKQVSIRFISNPAGYGYPAWEGYVLNTFIWTSPRPDKPSTTPIP